MDAGIRDDDQSLADLGMMLARGLVPSIAIALVAAVVVFLGSGYVPPAYLATATLLGTSSGSTLERFDIQHASPPPIDLVAYRSLALSRPILERAGEIAAEPEAIARSVLTVRSEVMNASTILRIEARAADAERAAAIANAVGGALIEWDRQRATENMDRIIAALEQQVEVSSEQLRQLQVSEGASVARVDAQIVMLNRRLEQLTYARALRASPLAWLQIIEPARPPELPFMPLPSRYAVIAFLVVAFVAYGGYLFAQVLDTRIKTGGDVARATGLPVLAEFRVRRGTVVGTPSFGYLRASVEAAVAGQDATVIVVTGPEPSSVQSGFALELAGVCAEDGHRTLLVDADFGRHALTQSLRIDPGTVRPLAAYLDEVPPTLETFAWALDTHRTVEVVPNDGLGDARQIRDRRRLGQALDWMKREYDVVIVDAAPLAAAPDAVWIKGPGVRVILVADVRAVTGAMLRRAVDLAFRTGLRPMGWALTGVRPGAPMRRSGARG